MTTKFKESFIEKDQFINEEIPGSFNFTIEGTNHYDEIFFFGIIDKNIVPPVFKAIRYSTNNTEDNLKFIDGFVELCFDADSKRIMELSGREIDSYLRDETNSQVFSHPMKLVPLLDGLKKKFEKELDKDIIRNVGEKNSPTIIETYKELSDSNVIFDSSTRGDFLDLKMDEKQIILNEIIDKFISRPLFIDGGGVNVVFIDGSLVVIEYYGECTGCTKSLTSTMDYIGAVFKLETNCNQLLVVTDS